MSKLNLVGKIRKNVFNLIYAENAHRVVKVSSLHIESKFSR